MLRIRKKLVTHWQPRKLITKQRMKHFKMHLLVCFHQLADKQHFSITRKNRNSGTSLSVTLGNESGGDTSSTNGHGSSGKKATKNKAKMTTDIQSLVDLTHAHPEHTHTLPSKGYTLRAQKHAPSFICRVHSPPPTYS